MVVGKPQTGQNLSHDMFYMWRCVIALAHADGKVVPEERAYLDKVFSNMDRAYALTAEQKKTFADDLEAAQDIWALLRHINNPAVRGQLIYFCGLLARADGHEHPSEESIIKKLRAEQMASIDMEAVRGHVKEAVADEMFRHDLSQSAIRPQHGISGIIDHFLQRLGIDIL